MRNYYLPYYNMAPTDYLKPEIYVLFSEKDLRRNLISTKNTLGESLPYPYCGALGAHTNLGCALPEVYLMLAECEARAGSESEAKRILKEFRSYRLLDGYEDVPASVKTKEELIRFCVEEQTANLSVPVTVFIMYAACGTTLCFRIGNPLPIL